MPSRRLALAALSTALLAGGCLAQSAPTPKARAACMADVQRLCAGVTPGGGRIMRCLRDHQSEVSEGCKAAVAERQAEHRASRAAAGAPSAPAPSTPPS